MDAYERRINFLERQVKSLTSINKATSTAKATSTEKNDEYIPGDEARLKSSSQKQDEPKSTGTAQKVIGWILVVIGVITLLFFPSAAIFLIVIGIVLIATAPHKAKSESKLTGTIVPLGSARGKKQAEADNIEANIGKNLLPKIGIISLVLGVALFVIYAIQNKWIGPTGQVALGSIAGIMIVAAGVIFFNKDYQNYGLTLVGGGFALLYFSIFAAHKFYNLLDIYVDVGALSLIIAAAVFLSIKLDSKIIAGEAFLLGYLVPLLTTQVNTFFLVYALVLTLAVTILVAVKGWKIFGAGAMAGMYLTHFFWLNWYKGLDRNMWHIGLLAVYFVMFAVMALRIKDEIGKDMAKDSGKEMGQAGNTFFFMAALFVVTYIFMFSLRFKVNALILAPLALLIIVLGIFMLRFSWKFFILGSLVLNYLVHLRWLDQNMGPSIMWTNMIATSIYFVLFNIVIFLTKESNKAENVISIVANSFFYYGINLFMIKRFEYGFDGAFTAVIAIFFLVMAYLAYNMQVRHFFNTYLVLCFGYLALAVPLQFNIEWVTLSWSAISLILLLLSFRLKENVIRISSSVTAIITLIRVVFFDTWQLNKLDLVNILNSSRIFAFLSAIISFYIISYIYYKNKEMFPDTNVYIKFVRATFAVVATILTTIIIYIEINDASALVDNQARLWTSMAVIFQSIVILSLGFMKKFKLFRIMGLVLFGLALVKVLLYDLSYLGSAYRIVSFIVLGIIALLGSFLYNRFKEYI